MDVAPPDDGLHDMEVEPPDISLPEDRAGEDLGEYSGGTSLLNYSVIKTSQYSGIKPSEYSGVKPSEYSGTTGSKHSGITESKYSRIKSPEFSGITGSKYSGGTFPSKYSGIKAPEYSGSASKRSVVSGVGNQRNTQRNIRTPNVYAPGNSFVKHGASVRGWEQTPEKGTKSFLWKLGIPIMGLIAALVIWLYFVGNREELSSPGMEKVTESFLEMLKETQRRFPHQEPQLWARSTVLLKKHLGATTHSEPSILMFAAALDAEKTMRCLSRSIAGAYASALGSTAVEIDGSGKNLLDSDKVKMEIDQRLSSEFNEGKKAAVIHHFQDLPPPSTLLFYKYCDHENAAFKDVSLLITILLTEERLQTNMSFPAAEEKVRDFLLKRFFEAQDPGTMNMDKLSGLWSRIAHLVLLVGPEQEYEENGCKGPVSGIPNDIDGNVLHSA
ncbi:torsin-1A-interacting protein 2 isoform X2 [Callorhinchus milii]|uniref:torsin-1A-interacting protein 2 isoform X2 n=1 Tax=Callorhinchus milii TaxID=7868 RepID=UPI001C3FF478|nr:torsin-1A-interacting protein 2 isoform X2 [Callorhinchus milii]